MFQKPFDLTSPQRHVPDGVREARARQQDVQRTAGLRQQVQVHLQRLAGRHQTSGNGKGSSGKQLQLLLLLLLLLLCCGVIRTATRSGGPGDCSGGPGDWVYPQRRSETRAAGGARYLLRGGQLTRVKKDKDRIK